MRSLLAFLIVCLSVLPAHAKYAGGTGEPNDPYQIATAADLVALGETPEDYDKHFILTADIDLDPNLPGRKVFDKAVIAPGTNDSPPPLFQGTWFTGVFDGRGHAILHLTIEGEDFLGLFGGLDSAAVIKNLGVVDANVTGSSDVGGLVGWNYGSTLTQCYSTGAVGGMGDRVGGLAGSNGGSVVRCYSASIINGRSSVGGLVGSNDADRGALAAIGTVIDSYSIGAVSGSSGVGGLVGDDAYGRVTQCYSAGSVRGSGGGLVGRRREDWGHADANSCFWDIQTSGQATSAVGTGKTMSQMQTARTFLDAGWDFVNEIANGTDDVWWILEGQDYPRLSWERVLSDDFEDGKAGPLWFVYEVDANLVQIKELNGRLEITASAQAQNVDAFYAANGWRLDATKDFAIRVDFHFSKQGGGDGRVTLGVVPGLDPDAMQWAEFEAGCFDTGPFYLYEVRDGFWVQERVIDRSSDSGTLYMSYNPDTDELYFSPTGYGKPNAWETVTGLLGGRWAGGPVYVILGGGSEGMTLTGADAWLDNFVVNTGTIPE